MHRHARTLLLLTAAASAAWPQAPDQTEFFEKKIRPLLVSQCQPCHNAKVKTSGLDLSSAAGFNQGGPSGPLFSKTDPEHSLILQVIGYEGRLKMPPSGKLKDEDRALLQAWVEAGAKWPGGEAAAAPEATRQHGRKISAADRQFWAFRPVAKPEPPAIRDARWAANPVDRFILAKLEEKGLKPSQPADKLTLLRRITYDLTGLPPTEAEAAEFLNDKSPEAWQKVVDRLLASPRYGEKWGRHWLDVARYADSTGNDEDHRYPYAWRYRDYVIEAFNKDLPYNQFVREQIAGDLMPAEHPGEINRRGIIATGFLALGAKAIAQQDKKKMLYDVYDEQVDVTSKAIMGVTLACARCHDHKFDPLLTRDYYSMIGMFASTKNFSNPDTHVSQLLFTPLVPKEEMDRYRAHQNQIKNRDTEIEDIGDQAAEAAIAPELPKIADYMLAAREVYTKDVAAAAVAAKARLREDVLTKWVTYLKPRDEVRVHLEKWYAANDQTAPEAAKAYQAEFEQHLKDWTDSMATWRTRYFALSETERASKAPGRPKFAPATSRFFFETYIQGPFAYSKKEKANLVSEDGKAKIAALRKEQEQLKTTLPPEPDMACAIQEGEPVAQKVFVRGDYNSLGQDAPKVFPVVLAGEDQQPAGKGSGRLELANWLARPEHPLTARVMANRIWSWHFGEGIVRTPDNFGRMGERPTHPELLDYLASEFVSNVWSVKKLHRMILLSNTYQMSSTISDEAYSADPENKLFSRFPRRRLDVEEIRDGLLAIDGTLDYTTGGTLQTGTGTDGENSNGRLSLRPESNKRRMVYLPLRRANLPTLLNLFDFGDATTMTGKRSLTTVAPQALFMMNSDFVNERAAHIADLAEKSSPEAKERVRLMYHKVLNREPSGDDLDAALTYVTNFTQKFAAKRTQNDAWLSLARTLISSNEFIYVD